MKYLRVSLFLSISLLSFITLLLLIYPFYRIGFSAISLNYNEGWNAYHAIKLFSEQKLYDGQNVLITVNYPPLSFYIVGGLGKLIHDPVLAGRYISFFSLFISTGIVIYIVNQFCRNIYYAVFSGVFCLSLFTSFAQYYVGMNDPQLLAHALMFIGFLIYLQLPAHRYRLLLAAAFIMAGLFTKHNLIALPLAVTITLLLTSRRNFLKWLIYSFIIALIFTIISINFAGSNFIHELLITGKRVYNIRQLVQGVDLLLFRLFTPLLLTIIWIISNAKNRKIQIFSLYFIISLFTGIYFSGGAGVNINIYFDTFFSFSILIGLLFSSLIPKYRFAQVLPIIISVGILVAARTTIIDNIRQIVNFYDLERQEQLNLVDAKFLANQKGNVLCLDNIFICYLSQKKFEYDPFNSQQKIATKVVNQNVLIDKIELDYFSTILVSYDYDNLSYNYSLNDGFSTKKNLLGRIRLNLVNGIADFLENKVSLFQDAQVQNLRINKFQIETLQSIKKHYEISHKSTNGTFYIVKQENYGSFKKEFK